MLAIGQSEAIYNCSRCPLLLRLSACFHRRVPLHSLGLHADYQAMKKTALHHSDGFSQRTILILLHAHTYIFKNSALLAARGLLFCCSKAIWSNGELHDRDIALHDHVQSALRVSCAFRPSVYAVLGCTWTRKICGLRNPFSSPIKPFSLLLFVTVARPATSGTLNRWKEMALRTTNASTYSIETMPLSPSFSNRNDT